MSPRIGSVADDSGTVGLRPASEVMRLARLGAFHPTRLSFARVLLRRAKAEGWQFDRPVWRIDTRGEGIAVYRVRTGDHLYSLIAFAQDLPAELRSDRVIAEAWDATFALHDGALSDDDIARLSRHVPRQEAGRLSAREITLSRANRSVRLFDHVVDILAAGTQPSAASLDAVGYLMRTTAVYGSGKFGLSDRECYAERPEFSGPFGAEMLTVWLIRTFTIDLVEHLAACRSAGAVRLQPALKRRLGVGNSTGLGMAPFVVHHAGLLDRWIAARETALARVLSLPAATASEIDGFAKDVSRTIDEFADWSVPDGEQSRRNGELRHDLEALRKMAEAESLATAFPWRILFDTARARLGLEAQELLVTLLLERHGALVDDLAETMGGDETPDRVIDGSSSVRSLQILLERHYDFALRSDPSAPEAEALFWYVSEEKLEPRLGRRHNEDGAEREQPLAIARDAARLGRRLAAADPGGSVADFLARHPDTRHVARRVQLAARRAYSEVRDNLIHAAMRPIDLLRCKLSFFGATRFDPKSDRWMRISLFSGAPFPDEVCGPLQPGGVGELNAPSPPPADGQIALSLNEIDAELRKAARGAGLEWGEAEEVGWAARRMAAGGDLMLERFAEVLERHAAGDLARANADLSDPADEDTRPLSPLWAGIRLMDRASLLKAGIDLRLGSVFQPQLLAAFLARPEPSHRAKTFSVTSSTRLSGRASGRWRPAPTCRPPRSPA